MTITLNDQVEKIKSQKDFIDFANNFLEDYLENPSDWENASLEAFLDALVSVIAHLQFFYENRGESMPGQVNWKTFAEVLLEAKSYTGEGY
jgi:hypothetical protein